MRYCNAIVDLYVAMVTIVVDHYALEFPPIHPMLEHIGYTLGGDFSLTLMVGDQTYF